MFTASKERPSSARNSWPWSLCSQPDICVLLISSHFTTRSLFVASLFPCDKFISFILISECINNRINCNHFSQFLISFFSAAALVSRHSGVNVIFGEVVWGREKKYENDCRERRTQINWGESGVAFARCRWRKPDRKKAHTKILRYEKHEN